MNKIALAILTTLSLATISSLLAAPSTSPTKQSSPSPTAFKPFAGKITGEQVRLRLSPDLDSPIISQLPKDEYVIVTGEKGDFFKVQPPADFKAYIFRGFVIDGVVEGEHVNVRLYPDREAPVIGHCDSGERVEGVICEKNSKWLEIAPPKSAHFYIAKEYVNEMGNVELKAEHDRRKAAASELLEATHLLSQSEMRRPFQEIDIDRIKEGYLTLINDYSDFPSFVSKARHELSLVKEEYLSRKIAYLESAASKMEQRGESSPSKNDSSSYEESLAPTDRMKVWEPIEESLFLNWSTKHHAKTIEDFYAEERMKSRPLTGIVESYSAIVKNKPGDFLLKERDLPIGYLYSTHVNLEEHVGKRVTLLISPRPNNHFAFPAYYVLDVVDPTYPYQLAGQVAGRQ